MRGREEWEPLGKKKEEDSIEGGKGKKGTVLILYEEVGQGGRSAGRAPRKKKEGNLPGLEKEAARVKMKKERKPELHLPAKKKNQSKKWGGGERKKPRGAPWTGGRFFYKKKKGGFGAKGVGQAWADKEKNVFSEGEWGAGGVRGSGFHRGRFSPRKKGLNRGEKPKRHCPRAK